ncbi:hypothetical protein BFP72_15185 [Reichenbachiella sp. 5M10]|uniref:hypothetical protein n=1 Tax=Reichenbachiella sp. 5M10 TaxID=1889772 RepID=UPI000C1528F7|nr:hypothetical protein [Reichenbachiella sp. 5M10]PIB36648.1 hypothetical protein BFP72_15185 [Reichenbachiella sp. 5M10]
MSISQITHQGKRIIFVDYSQCKNKKEMIDVVSQVADYLLALPDPHLLLLFDYTNAHGSTEFMNAAKAAREKILQSKTTKSAALGITGIKKILLNGYNAVSGEAKMKPFDNKEAALAYLLSAE